MSTIPSSTKNPSSLPKFHTQRRHFPKAHLSRCEPVPSTYNILTETFTSFTKISTPSKHTPFLLLPHRRHNHHRPSYRPHRNLFARFNCFVRVLTVAHTPTHTPPHSSTTRESTTARRRGRRRLPGSLLHESSPHARRRYPSVSSSPHQPAASRDTITTTNH